MYGVICFIYRFIPCNFMLSSIVPPRWDCRLTCVGAASHKSGMGVPQGWDSIYFYVKICFPEFSCKSLLGKENCRIFWYSVFVGLGFGRRWIRNVINSLDKYEYIEYGNCESVSYNYAESRLLRSLIQVTINTIRRKVV